MHKLITSEGADLQTGFMIHARWNNRYIRNSVRASISFSRYLQRRMIAATIAMIAVLTSIGYPSATAQAVSVQIESSFLPIRHTVGWSQGRWEREFADLKNSGINEIVSDGAVFHEGASDVAYYPSKIPGFNVRVDNSGRPVDQLKMLLQTAEKFGFNVWLGTYVPPDTWYAPKDATVEQDAHSNATTTTAILRELDSLYASHSQVISGWYLSSEISASWAWSWTASQALVKYYKELCDAALSAAITKETLISPYYNISALKDPALWTQLWQKVLRVAPISAIALQDGTGDVSEWVNPEVQANHIWTKFTSTRAAIAESGARTSLWANLNFYDLYGYARPILDIAASHASVVRHVSKVTSWSFTGHVSPWSLGTNAYYKPFQEWNITGLIKRAAVAPPTNLIRAAIPGSTRVSWTAATSGAYPIAYYRVFSPSGPQLAEVYSTTWMGGEACPNIQSVDVAGNVSDKVKTC
ncbi:DUF4434 domain-containing protein [Microbacterium maritypicum]|uniref:DUF4434 domain-containing protein n=1 Tax=Microbacterium maritypicum TaxID=33918 RepID=UPI0037FA863C